ncbi:hypothetical protein BKA66DRAFT_436244 [Pyrenochaeta sp. MPI-SDFR-AT-0127]|nr:hypothetical protein BKA66DRAFT_436244 [Pyrenochaeta sp. MPI-SDFR-AT-0127]
MTADEDMLHMLLELKNYTFFPREDGSITIWPPITIVLITQAKGYTALDSQEELAIMVHFQLKYIDTICITHCLHLGFSRFVSGEHIILSFVPFYYRPCKPFDSGACTEIVLQTLRLILQSKEWCFYELKWQEKIQMGVWPYATHEAVVYISLSGTSATSHNKYALMLRSRMSAYPVCTTMT